MRDLVNSRCRDGRFLWNAPALAALCRPLQDSFICFFYFGIEQVDDDEATFRELLLRRHHSFKCFDLLTRVDQKVPEIATQLMRAKKEAESIQEQVLTHRFFSTLPLQAANEIRRRRDSYLYEPIAHIWRRAGLPLELHEVMFRYLSQWVHATPYALTQLQCHQARHEDGAVNMNVPVGLALSCTCLVLDRTARLATSLEEFLPKGFREFLGE
jgi:hypothetical protein